LKIFKNPPWIALKEIGRDITNSSPPNKSPLLADSRPFLRAERVLAGRAPSKKNSTGTEVPML